MIMDADFHGDGGTLQAIGGDYTESEFLEYGKDSRKISRQIIMTIDEMSVAAKLSGVSRSELIKLVTQTAARLGMK
jgi:hypothetical protein